MGKIHANDFVIAVEDHKQGITDAIELGVDQDELAVRGALRLDHLAHAHEITGVTLQLLPSVLQPGNRQLLLKGQAEVAAG